MWIPGDMQIQFPWGAMPDIRMFLPQLPTMLMPSELSLQAAILLGIFIITIFFIYRTIKTILRAAIFAAAGFIFPWIIRYTGLNLPIPTTIETSIYFAILAVTLFFLYEFLHFIAFILKLITLPFRGAGKWKKEYEIDKIKKELNEIEAKKRRGYEA